MYGELQILQKMSHWVEFQIPFLNGAFEKPIKCVESVISGIPKDDLKPFKENEI